MSLEERLSYAFHDRNLLKQAFTHRSFGSEHNERLEFLGDAFLNSALALWLYQQLPGESEGALTRARAALVKKGSLVEYARHLELDKLLFLGGGESKSIKDSVLADAFEAVFGALFLDAGFLKTYNIFVEQFDNLLQSRLVQATSKDAKTLLQEYAQKEFQCLPMYEVIQQVGQSHQPTFIVGCVLLDHKTQATGSSKKEAESIAASMMLAQLQGSSLL